MHPSNVMATISRPSFVRDNRNKLVVASVKSHAMLSVKFFILLLQHECLLSSFSSFAHNLLHLVLFIFCVFHHNVFFTFSLFRHLSFLGLNPCKSFIVFCLALFAFDSTTFIELGSKFVAAELIDVKDSWILNFTQDLGFSGICASYNTLMLPVEANELDTKVRWLKKLLNLDDAYQFVNFLDLLVDGVSSKGWGAFFDLTLKRDFDAFCQHVNRFVVVVNVTAEFQNLFFLFSRQLIRKFKAFA